MLTIGIAGLGLLGLAVAERWLAAGCHVWGVDPVAERRHLARAAGVEVVESASARHPLDYLALVLPDGPTLLQFLQDPPACLTDGCLVLNLTTCSPEESLEAERRCRAIGIGYLEVLVSGSSAQTRSGEALLLIGAHPSQITAARPALAPLGQRQIIAGPPPAASRLKLVTNLVLGLNRLALAEGLALALAVGLDGPTTLEALRQGAAYSRAMDVKGQRMLEADYTHPEARLSQHLKDVRLIRELAGAAGQPTPTTDLHCRLLETGVELGLGELDNSAVRELLSRLRSGGESP